MGWLDRDRERMYRQAVKRQDKGYPSVMSQRVASVSDDHWVSQFDASDRLNVSMWAIGIYIASGRLVPAENPAGQAGVTRASVDEEAEWRRGRSAVALFWRRVKDQLRLL